MALRYAWHRRSRVLVSIRINDYSNRTLGSMKQLSLQDRLIQIWVKKRTSLVNLRKHLAHEVLLNQPVLRDAPSAHVRAHLVLGGRILVRSLGRLVGEPFLDRFLQLPVADGALLGLVEREEDALQFLELGGRETLDLVGREL